MPAPRSDVLVLFGATGDLAYKQILPALHAMIRRGHLKSHGRGAQHRLEAAGRSPRPSVTVSDRFLRGTHLAPARRLALIRSAADGDTPRLRKGPIA